MAITVSIVEDDRATRESLTALAARRDDPALPEHVRTARRR